MSDEAARRVGREAVDGEPGFVEAIVRPGKALTAGAYAGTGSFEDDKEVGVFAAAGVGYSRAEWGYFDAEAKGPNASAGAKFSLESGAQAMAKAEVASASAAAGPVKAKLGLAVDTGVGIGPKGVEAKLLGTGVTIGREMGISLFGSELKLKLW